MISAISDFQERVKEVRSYFGFLERLDGNESRLHVHTNSDPSIPFPIDDTLLKTFKATAFLLLYNLVESTLSNAIQSIYDELKIKNISYMTVRDDLKRISLKNLAKLRMDNLHTRILDISVDIITIGFSRRGLFSGNVDARFIRRTSREYGFSHETTYIKTRDGESLLTVKNHRNDLAHGIKSFSEVGKEVSITELGRVKDEVISYLEEILWNVDQYVSDEDYLHITYRSKPPSLRSWHCA
jgi:hypothetical protein